MADSAPQIRILRQDHGPSQVMVFGHWNFLDKPENQHQALEQLARVGSPEQMHWNLVSLDGLDSAGALTLWRSWGKTYPPGLDCNESHRRYFNRLQDLPEVPSATSLSLSDRIVLLGAYPLEMGRSLRELVLHFGQVVLAGAYATGHPRFVPWMELSATIYRSGLRASGLIAVINFLVGMMAAYQIGQAVTQFAANTAAVGAFSTAVLREISPWVTAILVAGRTGAGITAGIGSMQLTGELAALRAFGGSPVLRLALPRVVALAITVPLLVLLGDLFCVLGGVLVSEAVLGIPSSQFLQRLPQDVDIINFWIGEIKGLTNGIVVGVVSTFYGLQAAANTQSLSQQTTSSVIMSLSLVLVVNAVVGVFYVDSGLL